MRPFGVRPIGHAPIGPMASFLGRRSNGLNGLLANRTFRLSVVWPIAHRPIDQLVNWASPNRPKGLCPLVDWTSGLFGQLPIGQSPICRFGPLRGASPHGPIAIWSIVQSVDTPICPSGLRPIGHIPIGLRPTGPSALGYIGLLVSWPSVQMCYASSCW